MTLSDSTTAVPPLTCEQTVRRLWDYLDRELTDVDATAVERHLQDCSSQCASHFAFERAFLDVTRSARPQIATSVELRQRVSAILGISSTTRTNEDR